MKLLGFELLDPRNGRKVYINPALVASLKEGVQWGDWWRESSCIITLADGTNYQVVGDESQVRRFLENERSEGTFKHELDEDDKKYGSYRVKLAFYREELSRSASF